MHATYCDLLAVITPCVYVCMIYVCRGCRGKNSNNSSSGSSSTYDREQCIEVKACAALLCALLYYTMLHHVCEWTERWFTLSTRPLRRYVQVYLRRIDTECEIQAH